AKGDLEAFTVKPDGAGFVVDHQEVFMVGLGNTDVEFGPDGRMYLSCFNNNGWYKQDLGNIYALEAENPPRPELLKSTEQLLKSPFSEKAENELSPLLAHPDMRVRLQAQFELAERGSETPFVDAVAEGKTTLQRLHGVWGAGQLLQDDRSLFSHLVSWLSDRDPEVRAQAAKTLSDSREEEAGEALFGALDDSSARVRSFAAIGVGRCGYELAYPKLIELLAENADEDVFLRHSLVEGLWGLNEREKMLKETKHESRAVRLGVLLALRKLEDPRVEYFLRDEDPFLQAEAIRAINDLNLVTALPSVASKLTEFTSVSGATMPEGHRDWITHTRIINAAFRVGTTEDASNLLHYSANPNLAPLLREQAILALLEWEEPTPVDPTNGYYRPLDSDSRTSIAEVVKRDLPAVFKSASGTLLGLATKLALRHGAHAPEELLRKQILDKDAKSSARIGSLEGLARQSPEAMDELWATLLKSKETELVAATVGQLLVLDEDRGLNEAIRLADSSDYRSRQAGYRLLGSSLNERAAARLLSGLEEFESEPIGSRLDLLEAATNHRENREIEESLTGYEASLDPSNPLASFHPTVHGGDVELGKEIFLTHAAGQCAKCHKVNGDGGVAGPDLTGIGSRYDNKYLLESLVDPSRVVVPGYGMMMVSLKDGETVGGTLMEETKEGLVLKVPDPKGTGGTLDRSISNREISSKQPPISAMPPMGYILTKSEIRDLVAYLSSLKEKKKKKGH
ncbi:MAG: HEAT repeat domain-containing protein, partial [Verrucomicrobiota bacterium]